MSKHKETRFDHFNASPPDDDELDYRCKECLCPGAEHEADTNLCTECIECPGYVEDLESPIIPEDPDIDNDYEREHS